MSLNESIIEKLHGVVTTFQGIEKKLEDPELVNNLSEYQKIVKHRSDLEGIVTSFQDYQRLEGELTEANALAKDEEDPEMLEMAEMESAELQEALKVLEDTILVQLMPKDPLDEKNVFLEIRAGAGGDEAALFASDLFRAYSKYSENRKWKVGVISSNVTGIGGIKEIVLSITGKNCYSFLRFESGVHRVQRVPATETGGRVHTSTVTVAVLPEAEDVEIDIEAKDLRIDTFCSSGPGGQSVNTTYSAVRITHIPTGTVVSCQDEKSQIKNKAKGMRVLRSRIMKLEREKHDMERTEQRRSQVGSGDRSEKIKTYNFSQNRVTDHRMGYTIYNLEAYLEGDIENMINKIRAYDTAERLKDLFS